jgi:hypothetical protein
LGQGSLQQGDFQLNPAADPCFALISYLDDRRTPRVVLTLNVSATVTDFLNKRLHDELASNVGLALVGWCSKRLDISGRVDSCGAGA